MDYTILPAVNATLNGICTVLLVVGWILIRQQKRDAHRNVMIAAGVVSALFLTSYLIYHANVGSVKFEGTGWIRPVYFFILISHILLAFVIAVLVPMTFWRAYKQRWDSHRKIARVTMPIWLYVSVTGVLIYLLLYRL